MARAIITSSPSRGPAYEPLYDIDPHTGATIEVFYGDAVLARSFGAQGPGWFVWRCERDAPPSVPPAGPFATSYAAYRASSGAAALPRFAEPHPSLSLRTQRGHDDSRPGDVSV